MRRIADSVQRHYATDHLPEEHVETTRLIAEELVGLWQSDEVRVIRPTVSDEVKNGLYYFEASLLDLIPQLYRELEIALAQHYPEHEWRVPPLLRFGSWMGGDRDGNPYVTPDVTVETVRLLRVRALQRWLAQHPQAPLDVVGCSEHQQLAREVAQRAITLVRNDQALLPLRLDPDDRIALVMPHPGDMTPADTSSYVQPGLAAALRHYHPRLDEFQTDQDPTTAQIAALKEQVSQYDLLILVTLSASLHPAQAEMARQLLNLQIPTITVAARTPYDLTSYPQASTHLCTYSIQPPSMQALAAALWGQAPITGTLPVRLPTSKSTAES